MFGVIHKGRPCSEGGREGGRGSSQVRTKADKGEGGLRRPHLHMQASDLRSAHRRSQQPAFSNRAGQTDVDLTDNSCTTAPALRQFTAETVGEVPLPYHDTALASHSLTNSIVFVVSPPSPDADVCRWEGVGPLRTRGRVGQFG